MSDTDPRKLDWPQPQPPDDAEEAHVSHETLQRAAEGIRHDLRRLPDETADAFAQLLAAHFEDSPDPVESITGIERILRTDPARAPEFVAASLASPPAFRRLYLALGHSRALARHIARGGWRGLLALDDEALGVQLTADAVARGVQARLAGGESALRALRANHHDFALRVLLHEVLLKWPLEVIGREISALADGALHAALDIARREFHARRDLPAAENFRFCVIAMGKHGAQELNYSSDIDLMFVYDGEGPRGMTGQQYAVKLAEQLIPLLDEVTEDGMVFRVDTRLRPEGKRGRLARSVQGTLDYYFSFGSTWERQALLKARACAGDVEIGAAMLEKLSGWVFRRYLTVEEINQLQDVKRSIEQRTDERAETFLDIKTGFGGIRDIEFVTQFLQLLNGGRITDLRRRDTLGALDALAAHGVLRAGEAAELAAAYRFLRGLEHRLQLWEGAQTHTLPQEMVELARIGRSLGLHGPRQFDPARQLLSRLRAHTLRSRGLLVRLFAGLFERRSNDESELVLDPDMDSARAAGILRRYGFSDSSGAFAAIRDLAEESGENRLYAPRARKYLASMMPALLDLASGSADPDATLRNFERIASNLGAKTMLFELVAEDPRALSIFGAIAAHSDWLSDILARRPGLVDEFIDGLQTFTAPDRARLATELEARVAGAESLVDALFWQRDVELLRIGLFDVTGRTPLPETLRELALLAEVLLARVLEHAIAAESARAELVSDPRARLCVIGMGKLGSGSLHYASDLDLVFAFEPGALRDPGAEGGFYGRVVRRVLDALTTSGERGKLYDVDLRLRPHGSKGSLAVSLDELGRYLQTGAGFWERIAACRARVLNPGSAAAARAESLIETFCYDAPGNAAEMRLMRARLRESGSARDLKRGQGGTLDIEFMAAHLQLSNGGVLPDLRRPDLFAALRACRDAGMIDPRDHDAAIEAYAFLRQAINRMQLHDGKPHDALPADAGLEACARRMGYAVINGEPAADQFRNELDWHRNTAAELFRRYVAE